MIFEVLCMKYGHDKVKKCGLFVSRKYPFLGASPDAIYEDFLIEIKCPFNLRDTSPTDLSKLTKDQLRATFLEKDGQSVRIKRSHKYFLQAQFQMFVTGFQKLKFCVQTPFGLFIETILAENDIIEKMMPAIKKNYDLFLTDYFEMKMIRNLPILKLNE